MATTTHRLAFQVLRAAVRETAWTSRSVLVALIRAGIRQPALVPIRVERSSGSG